MNLTLTGLKKIADDFLGQNTTFRHRVLVCAGTGCLINGSLRIPTQIGHLL